MRNKILATIFYLTVSLYFFRGIFASPGLIIGGDWNLPHTYSQIYNYAIQSISTWQEAESLFGIAVPHLNDYPFHLLVGMLLPIGVSGAIFSKFLLIFLFTLAGFGMYSCCRFLRLNEFSSIFGGLFFITTPLFFNYAIMGWQYVILSLALLPFAIIVLTKSVKEQRFSYAVLTGLLFSIATLQSQSLVWYPIVFVILPFFVVESRKEFIAALKSLAIIFVIFFLINISWLIPMITQSNSVVSKTVSEFDIGRFGMRLTSLNFLRLWGSLFNYQYESSIPSSLVFASLIPPFAAYLALVLRKKDRMALFFAVLSVMPLVFFVGRGALQYIPFSNVIRDYSRHMIFSTFAYPVLIAISIDALLRRKNKRPFKTFKLETYKINAGFMIAALLMLNFFPFLTGEIYGPSRNEYDIRLRTLKFPKEYYEAEKILTKETRGFKALYLPIGGTVGLLDDQRFKGAYREISDIFSKFAPVPSAISFSDKGIGIAGDFAMILQQTIYSEEQQNLQDLLNLANIKYLVIRLNMHGGQNRPDMKNVLSWLEKNKSLRKIFEKETIVVFENTEVFSQIYASLAPAVTEEKVNDFPALLAFDQIKAENGIFFRDPLKNTKKEEIVLRKASTLLIPVDARPKTNNGGFLQGPLSLENSYKLGVPKTAQYEIFARRASLAKQSSASVMGKQTPLDPALKTRPKEWVKLGTKRLRKGEYPLGVLSDEINVEAMMQGDIILKTENNSLNKLISPEIRFKKINPTKYLVRVTGAKDPYHLVFLESFHPGWKAYLQKPDSPYSKPRPLNSSKVWETWFKKPLPESRHYTINGYANDWYIEPKDSEVYSNYEIILEFWPQRVFYLGLGISLLTLLGCFTYLILELLRREKLSNSRRRP